ncbi:ABC transporter permease [Microbacterium sp. E-13]|uniref:ABC transporter permease n=1 Tax=Microbacterium sp. E-13 TaxID=3404048 RepID=UPI003CE75FE9
MVAVTPATDVSRGPSVLMRLGAFLRRETMTAVAMLFLALVLLVTFAPGVLAPFDPLETDPLQAFLPPSWPHVLGTDSVGRDVLSRMIYGASASMPAALLATGLSLVIGVLLGLLAATFGGWVDAVVMRVFDAVLAIPGLLIIFAFLAVLGNGILPIAVAVGVGGAVSFGRLMRAEVFRVRSLTYVEAARASGVRGFTIARRHVVPGAIRPIIALTALDLGAALLTIGAIGYLGYGATPPTPEWGAMVADGQRYATGAWWLSVVPGVTFILIVLSANQIARYFEQGDQR